RPAAPGVSQPAAAEHAAARRGAPGTCEQGALHEDRLLDEVGQGQGRGRVTTAQQVLDVARGQIGYREEPPGSNVTKYGAWFGVNPAPWCSMFVSWVMNTAGAGALVAGARTAKGAAYSGDMLEHF